MSLGEASAASGANARMIRDHGSVGLIREAGRTGSGCLPQASKVPPDAAKTP